MSASELSKDEQIVVLRQRVAELETVERKYANLFEQAGDSILILDADTQRILDVNQAGARRLGYLREELLQMTMPEIEVPCTDEVAQGAVWQSLVSGTMVYESRYRRKDGTLLPVEISSRVITLSDRLVMQNVVRDITARKRAEQHRLEAVVQRERVAVLQQFISDASHDLNTPLTSIKALLWMLQLRADAAPLRKHLTAVELQVEHLERLVHDMLNMSRLDVAATQFELTATDMHRLVRDILTSQEGLVTRKGHSVDLTAAPDLPVVFVDPLQVSHALTNIIVNALHYTPEGGTITLRIVATASHVVVEVQDTGIGISADDLPHIFERFFRVDKARQTATGGSGLGLAIAKKVIEAHQGTIEVDSTLGAGSTFKVLLPIT